MTKVFGALAFVAVAVIAAFGLVRGMDVADTGGPVSVRGVRVGAGQLVTFTVSGDSARRMARLRSPIPLLAFTPVTTVRWTITDCVQAKALGYTDLRLRTTLTLPGATRSIEVTTTLSGALTEAVSLFVKRACT